MVTSRSPIRPRSHRRAVAPGHGQLPSPHIDAAVWLTDAIRAGSPLLWTGQGASYALAQAFAESVEELGCPSDAIPVYRARGKEACVISQAGRDLGVRPLLLVTGAERGPLSSAAPRLLVCSSHGALPEWLPLSFLRSALSAARAVLKLPPWPRPRPPAVDQGSELIVVAPKAGPLCTLVEAARRKLEDLALEAVSFDELGHGLHARLYRRPEAYRVVLLSSGDDELGLQSAARRWCADVGVAVEVLPMTAAAGSGARPLEMLDHGLTILETLCDARRIDWRTVRIPTAADWLRDAATLSPETPDRGQGGAR